MNNKKPDYLLLDTSVLLEDPHILGRIMQKGGIPFLSNTILQELDFNKNGEKPINQNARLLFREFTREQVHPFNRMPGGEALVFGDRLTCFKFRGGSVFVLSRGEHQTKVNNDHKIIEVAKDYGLILLTRDNAMVLQAGAAGVSATLWSGNQEHKNKKISKNISGQNTGGHETSVVPPFDLPSRPNAEMATKLQITSIPTVGGKILTKDGKVFPLKEVISRGGEGIIYRTSSDNIVCKIYHPECLTNLRKKKIELMLTRRIDQPGICWPSALALNEYGEFVGYVMPMAQGRPIQSTMFVKPVLEKAFPAWTRKDLVKLCKAFLQQVEYLHSLNIIIGDINPLNFLVTPDSEKIWLVDTDSFQVGSFPCPVGTINFTAPEIQGREYPSFLRTKEHELFAVATMLFMLLHPGKPPYSQQGGGSPGENIKKREFPYGFKGATSSKNTPQGPWGKIWGNLPYKVKEAFHQTFHSNHRLSIPAWRVLLDSYLKLIQSGEVSDELFPTKLKIKDGIPTLCRCGNTEDASKKWLDKLASEGRTFLCASCVDEIKMRSLVRKSREANEKAMNAAGQKKGAASPTPTHAIKRSTSVPLSSGQQRKSSTQYSTYGTSGSTATQKKKPPVTAMGLLGAFLKHFIK